MPWSYSQSTGELMHDGRHVATGYSGTGLGLNNPGQDASPNIGPIPRGTYRIGAPFRHPHAGAYTMRLTPIDPASVHGRTGLMMHGDSRAHPGQASNGCIIENLSAREQVWNSNDHLIVVTP